MLLSVRHRQGPVCEERRGRATDDERRATDDERPATRPTSSHETRSAPLLPRLSSSHPASALRDDYSLYSRCPSDSIIPASLLACQRPSGSSRGDKIFMYDEATVSPYHAGSESFGMSSGLTALLSPSSPPPRPPPLLPASCLSSRDHQHASPRHSTA